MQLGELEEQRIIPTASNKEEIIKIKVDNKIENEEVLEKMKSKVL